LNYYYFVSEIIIIAMKIPKYPKEAILILLNFSLYYLTIIFLIIIFINEHHFKLMRFHLTNTRPVLGPIAVYWLIDFLDLFKEFLIWESTNYFFKSFKVLAMKFILDSKYQGLNFRQQLKKSKTKQLNINYFDFNLNFVVHLYFIISK
jgi:hypothetical protein